MNLSQQIINKAHENWVDGLSTFDCLELGNYSISGVVFIEYDFRDGDGTPPEQTTTSVDSCLSFEKLDAEIDEFVELSEDETERLNNEINLLT